MGKKQVFTNKLKYTPRQQWVIRLCREMLAIGGSHEMFLGIVNEESLQLDDGTNRSFLQVWRQEFSCADEIMTEKSLRELAAMELGD